MSTSPTSDSVAKAFDEATRYLTHQYKVGPLTMEHVFRPHRMTNLSDMQSVLDAMEAALDSCTGDAKCAALPDRADILETIENAACDWQAKGYPTALAEVRDMANLGRECEAREGLTPRAALHAEIRTIVDQALDKIESGE